mgnify:CR=1 FL=1
MLQRLVKNGARQNTRREYNRMFELIKEALIRIKVGLNFPVGITLFAKYSKES